MNFLVDISVSLYRIHRNPFAYFVSLLLGVPLAILISFKSALLEQLVDMVEVQNVESRAYIFIDIQI